MKKFTEIQIIEIINLYLNQNLSCTKIAAQYKCTCNTISKILKDNGIQVINKQNQLNFDLQKDIIPLVEQGISLTKIAKLFSTNRNTLSRHLKNAGVEVINHQNISKFNEHVFDVIDTEEKAYWLGFIYADGYISNITNKHEYSFEISLKASDVDHLYKFNTFMQHSKMNVKISSTNQGNFSRCRWQVANKHLWNTLNNYGCTPNKSLTLQFPDENIFKDKSLIIHFIRGYFDGDGCFSRHISTKTVSPVISIIGTKQFLTKIEEYLNYHVKWGKDKRWNNDTWSIHLSLSDSINFINQIYNNATIYLNRKYKLYNFFKNGSRSVQEWAELQSGNIGESPEKDNTEINSEIAQGSESSYSVEGE